MSPPGPPIRLSPLRSGRSWRCAGFLQPRQAALAVLLLALAGIAGACSHVPVASLLDLRKLDLETTDPGRLSVAVRHPSWLRVRPGGAVMSLRQVETASGRSVIDEAFVLEEVAGGPPAALAGEARPGTRFSIFRIAPADLSRLRSAQAAIAGQTAAQRQAREGTLSVSVGGCLAGPRQPGPVLVSTYLSAAEFGRFVPLVRDYDLETAAPGTQGLRPEALAVVPCPADAPAAP